MADLNTVDYTVIAIYVCCLIVLGFYLKKKAAASLEDYFLGGKQLPWWALGCSGMASFLDITGTMIIVSFLYMLGPRGLYIEFRGGAVLILVFMLLWVGKWHRRSNCMTGAEWQIYRFGAGPGGRIARVVAAFAGTVFAMGMLAYMTKGVGLFLSMFIDLPPTWCAFLLMVVATLYTMASGFYGVVYTDIFQSVIILVAVVAICFMAVSAVSTSDIGLAELAEEVTGSKEWMGAAPHLHTEMPEGYKQYSALMMFMMFYLVKNIMNGVIVTGDPKYFGARNERECGLLTFLWTWLMMVRWPMMMGFAVLGLFLVRDLFPNQDVLVDAAAVIKEHIPEASARNWEDTIATINAESRPALAGQLEVLLGEDWRTKLKLLSFQGTVNPERILPAVLLFRVHPGFRGLLLVALIAASMSTFDSTVNMAAGLFTRDIYQGFLRPAAANRELILATYAYGAVLVAVGFTMGAFARNINDIWGWIIMGLGTGLVWPGILRLYWWRFNAAGVIVGTLVGMIAAFVQRGLLPDLDERWQFLALTPICVGAGVIGTYLFPPTHRKVLENFYRTTRPFGFWGPLKDILDPQTRSAMKREHAYDLAAVPFALIWQVTLFLIPMLLIIRNFKAAGVAALLFATGLVGMYFLWYRHLPSWDSVPTTDPYAGAREELEEIPAHAFALDPAELEEPPRPV